MSQWSHLSCCSTVSQLTPSVAFDFARQSSRRSLLTKLLTTARLFCASARHHIQWHLQNLPQSTLKNNLQHFVSDYSGQPDSVDADLPRPGTNSRILPDNQLHQSETRLQNHSFVPARLIRHSLHAIGDWHGQPRSFRWQSTKESRRSK
jgi:hypothetical protein